ncbi:MAG: hypothetical protein JNM85_06605 [Chthonomonas sp.]|nr:hypothetical protein [Chthonomonas sp.]
MSETLPSLAQPLSVHDSYRLIRDDCGILELTQRQAVILTGGDRNGWLQGQITNDLRYFAPGAFLQFCLCSATGQLEAIGSLWAMDDELVVITDPAGAEVLLRRADKMVILEEVSAVPSPDRLICVQGPNATERLGDLVSLPQLNSVTAEILGVPVRVLRSNRTGSGGWVVMVPAGGDRLVAELADRFPTIASEAYAMASMEFGSPQFGVDTDSKTLLPELGAAFESATISYKKGCYLGQEVLMRLHSRGHVNRQWMGMYTDTLVTPGDAITHARRPDAGVITSAFESPDFGFIAAGYVRREVAYSGEEVTVQSASGTVGAELVEMPILRLG